MKRILAILAIVGFTACGAKGTTPPVGTFAPQTATIVFSVHVPATTPTSSARGAQSSRTPQYISAATQSVAFTLTSYDGNTENQSTVVSLVPGTNCTGSGSSTTCTASSTAPVGSDVYSIATYSNTGGTGTPLSENTNVSVIVSAGANALSTTLDPVISSLAFSPASASAVNGSPSTGAVAIEPKDVAGDIIIGPGTYLTAAGVPDSITITCQTHLTPENSGGGALTTPLTSPSNASLNFGSIAYDGTTINGTTGGPLTCTATDTSTSPLTATFTLNLSATGTTTWTLS